MTLGITGASGFIGKRLQIYAQVHGVQTIPIPREAFADTEVFAQLLSGCDALVHCAALNRGTDEEIYAANVGMAEVIKTACLKVPKERTIVFASSIYANRTAPPGRSYAFGESKKQTAAILGSIPGTSVVTVFLPHVFGEEARPFHNSVVATLAYQIAHHEPSEIREGAVVELVYVEEVVEHLFVAASTKSGRAVAIAGTKLSVRAVYDTLVRFAQAISEGHSPTLTNDLELHLFDMMRYHISYA